MSIVKSVDEALNTPASELISAASSPATTMPRTPVGNTWITICGNAAWNCGLDRVAVGVHHAGKLGHLAALGEREADHAGNDEHEHRQQLEKAREDRAPPRVLLVLRAQRPLHDVLARAPIPEADHRAQISMPIQG